MNHHATTDFWDCDHKLPEAVRKLADANEELLRADSSPVVALQALGPLWSVRVSIG